MENGENDDLLSDDGESSVFGVSDYIIQDKILNFIQNERQSHKSSSGNAALIFSCFLLFISSTILLITLPIYIHQSNKLGISTYSKLLTLTSGNLAVFTSLYILAKWLQRCVSNASKTHLYLCLPSILKASSLQTAATVVVFWLVDDNLVNCHLQDPLKGCVVVFSLLFYFMFSRRKNSVERVFCSITTVVGTFVTVDYGLCNRYRCRGTDFSPHLVESHSWHGAFIVVYLCALSAFSFHLTILENCCRSSNYSSNLDLSVATGDRSSCTPLPSSRSLSIISGLRPDPLNFSIQAPKMPQTSTPNEGEESRQWGACDWLVAHHGVSWLVLIFCCWVPTLELSSQSQRLLADVAADVVASFSCHVSCADLILPSVILVLAYVLFAISSVSILLLTRSALTVTVVLMNALPMTTLFWSVYRLDTSAVDLLQFHWAVTGEAISALMGFPIIGVGTFLLLKSQMAQSYFQYQLH